MICSCSSEEKSCYLYKEMLEPGIFNIGYAGASTTFLTYTMSFNPKLSGPGECSSTSGQLLQDMDGNP